MRKIHSSWPKGFRQRTGPRLWKILSLSLALELTFLFPGSFEPREVYASTGKDNKFTEVMGISIAVGTVLGASTLPFYGHPGDHVGSSLAYGAIAGAVIGLGVFIYRSFQGSSEGEQADNRLLRPSTLQYSSLENEPLSRGQNRIPSAQVYLPVVSLNW